MRSVNVAELKNRLSKYLTFAKGGEEVVIRDRNLPVATLVPLCVHEAASRHAQSHLRRFAPVVWWGSLVEVHSAICRLHRDKEITDLDKQGAVARLRLLNRGWREILPDDQVRDLTTQLLDKHSLRAVDSLQLAASLIWCEQRPSRRSFICGDQRLAKAAASAGFSVLELSKVVP